MKNLIYYGITSTAIWYAAQTLGVGFGLSMFAALIGPPALKLALIARSMGRSGD